MVVGEPSERSRPRISICQITTLPATLDEDLAAYREAGVQGIGLVESKLEREPDALAKLRASGLRATHCVPGVPSILPSTLIPGPSDPDRRVESICASVRRFSAFNPVCVVVATGPDETQRPVVARGLRRIAEVAENAGVRVALEPGHRSLRGRFSFVQTVEQAVELADRAGCPRVGVLFDVWHMFDVDGILEQIADHADRIYGVHVSDRRAGSRGPFDRLIPGDGVIRLGPLLRRLEEAGYDGYFDIEIFSDNGLIADRLPDSLWDIEARELARRARDGFLEVWRTR